MEKKFSFYFPDDIKTLLQEGLPASEGFPNWRKNLNNKKLLSQINAPCEGVLFDIEHNSFWFKKWGETPSSMEEKLTKGEVKLVNEMEKKIPLTIQGPDVKDAGNMNTTMDEAQKGARQKFANEMAKNIGLSTPDADINDLSLETNGEFKNPSENKIRYDITIKNPRAFAKQYLFNSQKIGPKARKK